MGKETIQNMMNPTDACQYSFFADALNNVLNSFVCIPAFGPKVFFKV